MNEKAIKYYFWITGFITAVANIPMIFSPFLGTEALLKLNLQQLPFAAPLYGHWAMMVTCIGVYLFMAATNKKYRTSAVLYSNFEKGIMALMGWYFMFTQPDITINHYLIVTIGDTLFTIGGIFYLLSQAKERRIAVA
ncbi:MULTISPECIES: hypothetical protein [Flammeovirga]|uniref:Uncharacterized protein n=1 Tax=Flammeovirga agarivorans TaxID=2726742 RepID=A0A7X8SQE8_9BACT|nr:MULTISPECIES: hypothetical protein [Flammeovirga]NLR94499.1 hypothetical protein [Flammeovirga agarivorans]